MSKQPVPQPFLDWFGVWPGQAGRDDQGRAWLQDPPQGIRLKVQPARKSEVFFRPTMTLGTQLDQSPVYHSREWSLPHVVPRDGGVRRRPLQSGSLCRSDDGFDWQFPELGLYEFEGSKANNILCDGGFFNIHSVFKDPTATLAERYKAIESRGQLFRRGKPVELSPADQA